MNWPAHFLAEEIWLRARRSLLLGIEQEGFNIDEEEYRRYMEDQFGLGHSILRRLSTHLCADEYSYLVSELIFGSANRRFAHRLPFILAFGHQCCREFRTLCVGQSEEHKEVEDLAALFNLGISIFDHMTDHPAAFAGINGLITESWLKALLMDVSASSAFVAKLKETDVPEIKLFGHLVSSFFGGAHRLRAVSKEGIIWRQFADHIISAFRNQLDSTPSGGKFENLCHDGRAKSVEPFIIIALLVKTSVTPERDCGLLGIAEQVGEVFWRVDDLADLGQDCYGHQANCILARANDQEDISDLDCSGQLAKILNGGYIEEVTAETTSGLLKIASLLNDCGTPRRQQGDFIRWLSANILDWIR